MKKIILFILLISGVCFSQDYPQEAIELVVGKELKILPCNYCVKDGYYNFYKKSDLEYKNRFKHKYEDMNGKVFILKSFMRNVGRLKKDISLELFNKEIGTIYYEYEPWNKGSWIFEIIGGLTYPEGYWCKDIETKTDKFTETTKYNTPSEEHVFFIKEKGVTYIYLKSHGKTLNVNSNGVIILLNDGSKINKETAKIDVKVDGDGWYTYTSMFSLTDEEIKKISDTYITDYRLYIYDFKLDNGKLYSEYLKCLQKL